MEQPLKVPRPRNNLIFKSWLAGDLPRMNMLIKYAPKILSPILSPFFVGHGPSWEELSISGRPRYEIGAFITTYHKEWKNGWSGNPITLYCCDEEEITWFWKVLAAARIMGINLRKRMDLPWNIPEELILEAPPFMEKERRKWMNP